MEKTWETFWTTGKVTDYLTYRNEVTDVAESVGGHGQKEQQKYESDMSIPDPTVMPILQMPSIFIPAELPVGSACIRI